MRAAGRDRRLRLRRLDAQAGRAFLPRLRRPPDALPARQPRDPAWPALCWRCARAYARLIAGVSAGPAARLAAAGSGRSREPECVEARVLERRGAPRTWVQQELDHSLSASQGFDRVGGPPVVLRADTVGRARVYAVLDVVGLESHADLRAEAGICEQLGARHTDHTVREVAVRGEYVEREPAAGAQVGERVPQERAGLAHSCPGSFGILEPALLDDRREFLVVISTSQPAADSSCMNATSHVERRKNQLPITSSSRSISHMRRARRRSESTSWRRSSVRFGTLPPANCDSVAASYPHSSARRRRRSSSSRRGRCR